MTMHEDDTKWDKMKIYNARRKIMMSLHEIQWKATTMHWSEIKTTLHEIKWKALLKDGVELSWHYVTYMQNEKAMTMHEVKLRWHFMRQNERQWQPMQWN